MLVVVCCLWYDVWCLLCVGVYCVSFASRYVLFDERCCLFVVCSVFVECVVVVLFAAGRCLLVIVCCVLYVAC